MTKSKAQNKFQIQIPKLKVLTFGICALSFGIKEGMKCM